MMEEDVFLRTCSSRGVFLYCRLDLFSVEQVLAEFCAQDEDGQTPLVCAARSGSGAVFEQALEALHARAAPEKVKLAGHAER